jgi:hypothetical protein
VRARRTIKAARTSRRHGTTRPTSPSSCAPRLQAGRGGGLPHADNIRHRSSPKREARRGATHRRGAALRGVQPRAATAEDARPPRRPTTRSSRTCVATGGRPRVRVGGRAARAPAEQRRGRADSSNNAPPRPPQRSGEQRRAQRKPPRRGERSDREGASRASRRAASPPPRRGERGAPRRREHDRRRRAAPPRSGGGGGNPYATRRWRVPNSACAILLDKRYFILSTSIW